LVGILSYAQTTIRALVLQKYLHDSPLSFCSCKSTPDPEKSIFGKIKNRLCEILSISLTFGPLSNGIRATYMKISEIIKLIK